MYAVDMESMFVSKRYRAVRHTDEKFLTIAEDIHFGGVVLVDCLGLIRRLGDYLFTTVNLCRVAARALLKI